MLLNLFDGLPFYVLWPVLAVIGVSWYFLICGGLYLFLHRSSRAEAMRRWKTQLQPTRADQVKAEIFIGVKDMRKTARAYSSMAGVAGLFAALFFVLPAYGQGYSIQSTTTLSPGNGPSAVIIAESIGDLNDDDETDLIVANFDDNNVSVMLGDGAGGFLSPTTYAVGSGPTDISLVRMDAGSVRDLVVLNQTSSTVSVLLGDGVGGFGAAVHYPTGASPVSLFLWGMDAYTVNSDNTFSYLASNGVGGFLPKADFPIGNAPSDIAVNYSYFATTNVFVTNQADNTMSMLDILDQCGTDYFRTDFPTGLAPSAIAVGQLDADTHTDVVTANSGDNTVTVFLSDTIGGMRAGVHYPTGDTPSSLTIKDVNSDGHLDLITGNEGSNTVSVLLGDGNGGFAPHVDFATGTSPQRVYVGWIDQDAEFDLVTVNAGSDDITVLHGDIPGGYSVGDLAPELIARDQFGNLRSLSEFAGKWRIIDLCATWCVPCQEMADWTQQVHDSFVGHPTIELEYLTVITSGSQDLLSTQSEAQQWAVDNDITRPVLHGSGQYPSSVNSWYQAISRDLGTNVIPTLVFVDPQGVIRESYTGSKTSQELLDKIVELSGIASAPPLAPLPPPVTGFPAAPPTPLEEQALESATLELSYGAQTWTGPISTTQPGSTRANVFATGINVPWQAGTMSFYSRVAADATSGEESFLIQFFNSDISPIPTALPWTVKMTGLTWPDGAERVLTTPEATPVLTLHSDICTNRYDTGLSPTASLIGGALEVGPVSLAGGGLPPDPIALEITGLRTAAVPEPVLISGLISGAALLSMLADRKRKARRIQSASGEKS